MKKTRLLSLILAFLLMLSSVGVFAEETQPVSLMTEEMITLRDNIAETLADVEDGWTAMDMAAYESLSDGTAEISDATKLAIINDYIEEASGNATKAFGRARIEIVLSSLGVDTKELYAIGADTAINNARLLKEADHTSTDHYAAPWVLLANLQGNINLSDEQIDSLIDTLSANAGDGTFGFVYGDVTYADADTSGAVMAALAPFYGTNDNATALVDKVLTGLGSAISESGSFGSANSDAMVIIGLVALGENPAEFKHATSGKSVLDGLLSYANAQNNGFTFYGEENALATEQGFRALVALSVYEGAAYNIYDFSDVPKTPASQTIDDDVITLRDNIANVVKDVEDGWTAMDMAAYASLDDTTIRMSNDTKQNILNGYIDETVKDSATASDRARIEIVLRALGIDSTQLYATNSSDMINNAQLLKEADHTSSGHYAAPWVLLADLQGNLELTDAQTTALINVLKENSANGTFGYVWEDVTYPDPDTAAATLAALAPIYDTNDDAKVLVETILSAFDTMIAENGSFGSANSDAMVIIGLVAMGKNPAELKHSTSCKSVIDGLLSYVNDAGNGFTFNGNENYMATEQGFRALIALSKYQGIPYNIYDFSEKEVVPGRQESSGAQTPDVDTPDTPDVPKITVTFSIQADTGYWIENISVEIPEGGNVGDAFLAAIDATEGMSAVGAESGYVSSITKDGVTLSAGTNGKKSGWLFKVNGEKSAVGMADYVLAENDVVLWYYYKGESSDKNESDGIFGGGGSGYLNNGSSSSKNEETAEPEEPTEPEKVPEEIPQTVFADIDSHWAKEYVEYVVAAGIMNGMTDTEFAPDEKLTRGMLVTMLYRLSGDESSGENEFLDVADDAWYATAANWASANGITSGYGDGVFAADDSVTREQLVVFLMRYAKYKNLDTEYTEDGFEDSHEISDWATDAALWAKSYGIISGREDGTFDPKNSATRGEIAAVFMRLCENILK